MTTQSLIFRTQLELRAEGSKDRLVSELHKVKAGHCTGDPAWTNLDWISLTGFTHYRKSSQKRVTFYLALVLEFACTSISRLFAFYPTMPATKLRPYHRPSTSKSGTYTAIAVAVVIFCLAVVALFLWLRNRHRELSAKAGSCVNQQPDGRPMSEDTNLATNEVTAIGKLETGIIHEEPPKYQEFAKY